MYVDADSDLWTDPMTIRLAARAGIDPLTAGAIILRLRQWGAGTDQEDITGVMPLELATTLGYHGDADKLWEGLHAAGFLVDQDGNTLLGEYDSHIKPVVIRAKKQAQYQRDYRERQKSNVSANVSANKGANKTHVCMDVSMDGCMNTSTHQETKEKPAPKKLSTLSTSYTPDFEQFWKAYPRKEGKAAAFGNWNIRIKEGYQPETLIAAAQHWKAYHLARATEVTYIKQAEGFLGHKLIFLDFVDGTPDTQLSDDVWEDCKQQVKGGKLLL